MIISASYKTDIPTFYGDWFLNRVKAGYCKMINPYNKKVYKINLKREDVDGFVFWTKNLGPFTDKLEVIHQLGYPFSVQYTIHAYPRVLESSVVSAEQSIKYVKNVAAKYGSRVVVWRYDPIIFSSLTPREFHIRNFEAIAKNLEGSTDEVVISFAQLYKKTLRNMNSASERFGFTWDDPNDETKLDMTKELADIADVYNMKLTICSQSRFLSPGIGEARCIDANRLSDIAGYRIRAKIKGNRLECGCYESVDIGEYDTCPHGCLYCYAVLSRELAQNRFKEHDPDSEFLIRPKGYIITEDKEEKEKNKNRTRQTKLF
jgi:hypothetical protein